MSNSRCLCVVLCALLSAFGWGQVPRNKAIFEPVNFKSDVKLFDAYFVSEQVGWLAGGTTELKGGVIAHTEDAGANWTVQLGDPQSSDRAVRSLRFIDPQTGWAVQGSGGSQSRLLHTSDGQNWNQAGSIEEHYKDYAFTSATHGAYINARQIFLTDDAGRTWKPVATCQTQAEVSGLTRSIDCEYTSIHFPTPSTGYAVALSYQARSMFFLFKTADGGATWQASGVQADAGAEDVFFLDANRGYVRVGAADSGRLFRTTDGGQSFAGLAGSPGDQIKFADPEVGWAFHYGKMSYTTSGGDRWSSRSFTFPATVHTFSLPSRRRGFVVGEHGMVYRYSVVPVEYQAPGMIDAPMMLGFDLPVELEAQKVRPAAEALRKKLQAALTPNRGPATPRGGFANKFSGNPPAATPPPTQSGGFMQDTGTGNAFVQDTNVASMPIGPGVKACCAGEMQVLQASFSGFTQAIPPMVTRYRSLNLLLTAFHLFSDLGNQFQSLQMSYAALKGAPTPQAAASALGQFSTQLDRMAQSATRTMQSYVK